MNRCQRWLCRYALLPCVMGFLLSFGCSMDLAEALLYLDAATSSEDPTSPDDLAPAGTGGEAVAEIVTIRFRNLTVEEAVDVEFYASQNPMANLPDDLLVEENLVTASIGIAGTGIVQPLEEDVIEFPCEAGLTIGTRGGEFLDNETGEPRGMGEPRWAQEGPLALCGAVVTFEFAGDGVEFATALTIGR